MQDSKAPIQTDAQKRIYFQYVQITNTITMKMEVLCIYDSIKSGENLV